MNRNNTGIVMSDKNGKVFYSVGRSEHRTMVPLNDMPEHLKHALIASEDKDFYNHGGFSILSIFRAAFTRVGGGSTITQQLAKNMILSDQRSYIRKYQELFVAIAIEQQYTKDQILEMYLNSVFFGENAFGIEEAAQLYFNKKPQDLTLAESALLIGLLPAPNAYSPISGNKEYAFERQEIVLGRMVKNGFITEDEKAVAIKEELKFAKSANTQSVAPHFVEMVLKQLEDSYGYEQVMRSGYQVKTTLDLDLQKNLNQQVRDQLPYIASQGGSNASAVAIDPKTGEIRALVGSVDYTNKDWGMVNMATTARQPGSTFKTIYYAAALANGTVTPATVLQDKPINLNGWQPQNADRRFRGPVTLRNAISQSLNIPSIEVMQEYGVDRSIQAAKSFGITTLSDAEKHGLSLAIGSAEVPLVEMTNAYAALANEGQNYSTSIVSEIKDKFGASIYKASKQAKRAINQAGAFLISNILSDNSARAPVFGSSLTVTGHTAAVKTGTTDDNKDAWTIGYTPSLAVGVWVGNNNNSAMLNGGSGMAGPIWRSFMQYALQGKQNESFKAPDTVVRKATCYSNHGIATNSITNGTYQEYYLSTALPTATCTPEEPSIKVCDLDAKKVVEIKERDFNSKKHSKNLDDCKDKTIAVCEIVSGTVIDIKESAFDSTLHSRDTANCRPPDTDDEDSPDQAPFN